MERVLESSAFRLVLAVMVLPLARAVLHQPSGSTERRLPPPESRAPLPTPAVAVMAPTPQPAPSDPTEAAWQDAMRSYGQPLAVAISDGREQDLQRIWDDIGKQLRTRTATRPASSSTPARARGRQTGAPVSPPPAASGSAPA